MYGKSNGKRKGGGKKKLCGKVFLTRGSFLKFDYHIEISYSVLYSKLQMPCVSVLFLLLKFLGNL